MKNLKIRKNVCGIDRIARTYIGMALIGLYGTKAVKGTAGKILLIAGADILASAITQFCVINKAMGINTCRGKSGEEV